MSNATSQRILARIFKANADYSASRNISMYIQDGELEHLIDELEEKFRGVLDSLIIDQKNDPNSKGTARRLAKMYINELMAGRYTPAPDATSFPNVGKRAYHGMLVVRSEIKSKCTHHHHNEDGSRSTRIIPGDNVTGRS